MTESGIKSVPVSRPPTTAEQAQAQIAKAEAQKARAEAVARMFSPETKRIPSGSRAALIAALEKLASATNATEREAAAVAVERERASLSLTWAELIVPAAAETEPRAA